MMNNVSLVGRLTKDPELRFTPQGTAVCNFTIAVNRNYKNQQGEQEADFIMIQVWRKPAENAAKFLGKGSLVGITGRIQTRNYENQEGKRVYVTEILAEQVDYLDTRKNNNGGQGGGNGNYQGGNQNQNQNQNQYNDYQNGGQNQNQQNNYQQRGNQNQGYGNQQQDNYNPFGNAQNMQIDIADDDLPF